MRALLCCLVTGLALAGCGGFELADMTADQTTTRRSQAAAFVRMTPPEGLRRLQCRELIFATENAAAAQTARDAVEMFYVLGLSTGYVIGYVGGAGYEKDKRTLAPTDRLTLEFAREVGEQCRRTITMSVMEAVERTHKRLQAQRPDGSKLNIFQ